MDVQNPKTPLRTCAKQWCHRELAADYKWKQCEHCRERDQATKQNQRVKEKAKKNNATPQDSTSKKGKRRAEEDKSSSSEGEEEGRPFRRAKTEGGGSGPSFLDEDDELETGEEEVIIHEANHFW